MTVNFERMHNSSQLIDDKCLMCRIESSTSPFVAHECPENAALAERIQVLLRLKLPKLYHGMHEECFKDLIKGHIANKQEHNCPMCYKRFTPQVFAAGDNRKTQLKAASLSACMFALSTLGFGALTTWAYQTNFLEKQKPERYFVLSALCSLPAIGTLASALRLGMKENVFFESAIPLLGSTLAIATTPHVYRPHLLLARNAVAAGVAGSTIATASRESFVNIAQTALASMSMSSLTTLGALVTRKNFVANYQYSNSNYRQLLSNRLLCTGISAVSGGIIGLFAEPKTTLKAKITGAAKAAASAAFITAASTAIAGKLNQKYRFATDFELGFVELTVGCILANATIRLVGKGMEAYDHIRRFRI